MGVFRERGVEKEERERSVYVQGAIIRDCQRGAWTAWCWLADVAAVLWLLGGCWGAAAGTTALQNTTEGPAWRGSLLILGAPPPPHKTVSGPGGPSPAYHPFPLWVLYTATLLEDSTPNLSNTF